MTGAPWSMSAGQLVVNEVVIALFIIVVTVALFINEVTIALFAIVVNHRGRPGGGHRHDDGAHRPLVR